MTLVVFALSLGMRAIKFLLIYCYHIPEYLAIRSPIIDNKYNFLESLLFFCQYAVFDIMPITLLLYLHHKSFQEKHGESDATDDKSTGTQRQIEVRLSPQQHRYFSLNSDRVSRQHDSQQNKLIEFVKTRDAKSAAPSSGRGDNSSPQSNRDDMLSQISRHSSPYLRQMNSKGPENPRVLNHKSFFPELKI